MDFFGGSTPEDKPVHAGYRQKEKAWVLDDFTEWLNEMSLEPSYSGLLAIHDNKPFYCFTGHFEFEPLQFSGQYAPS